MTKSHALWTLIAVINLSAIAAAGEQTAGVALRYVTASYAFDGIKEHLDPAATNAVASVDIKRNVIELHSTHAEARVVRAFLMGLDQRPLPLRVDATITRISEPTGTFPARAEVLSRRTIPGGTVRPVVMDVPTGDGSIQVALDVTQMGASISACK